MAKAQLRYAEELPHAPGAKLGHEWDPVAAKKDTSNDISSTPSVSLEGLSGPLTL